MPPVLLRKTVLRIVIASPLPLLIPPAKQTSHWATLLAMVRFCRINPPLPCRLIAPPSPVRAMLPTKVLLLMSPEARIRVAVW